MEKKTHERKRKGKGMEEERKRTCKGIKKERTRKKGKKNETVRIWLVVLTILKNMSSSMGLGLSHILWKIKHD